MHIKTKTRLVAVTAVALGGLPAFGDEHEHEHIESIRSGHADILIVYDETEGLHLAIGAGEHEHEHGEGEDEGEDHEHEHEHLELDHAEIIGGPKAANVTTSLAGWEFMGAPDRYIYVLPQSEIEGLPFLGLNTEELEPGLLESNPVLSLLSVEGPGEFFLYQVDAFGDPIVHMNSKDLASNTYSVALGSHVHLNWAFSEAGEYEVTFGIDATLTGGTAVSSEPQTIHFHIVGLASFVHEGHADIGLEYEEDHGLSFFVAAEEGHEHHEEEGEGEDHEHEHEHEMHPADVVFLMGGYAVKEVPDNAKVAFLGQPGSLIYVIGQQEDEGVPFLGWNTENLDPAIFAGGINLELHSVEGPGSVFLYEVDAFGAVTVRWDSSDPGEDVLSLTAGVHEHLNLAVTAAGIYELEIHAEADLTAGGEAHTHGVFTLQAGGMEGYYGHFEHTLPYWIEAETGGLFYTQYWPWLWSPDEGWVFAFGLGGPNHYYYRDDRNDWIWTAPGYFPYCFVYGDDPRFILWGSSN